MRVNNIVMLEKDASVSEDDVEINVGFLDDQEILVVDVMIEKLGLRIFCNIEGLQLGPPDG